MSKATDAKFTALLATAFAAGAAAGAAAAPTPMVVTDGRTDYYVADGVCGFGWVHIKGNTAFGKWAKTHGHARPDYPTGLAISSKLMTQSMVRNEAWARAVADVLTAAGIPASARSRID